jgi:alpha-L-fucosidase
LYYIAKDKNVYVICMEWPEKELKVEGAKGSTTKVTMLGIDAPVKFLINKGVITIQPPVVSPAKIYAKYAYVFKVENVTKE